jgi:hypothetical protein
VNKLILLASCIIVIITIILEAVIFLHITRLPFIQISVLGVTNSLTHWIVWIGTLYVAFATPFLPIIKRKASKHFRAMLNVHMIGNLLAVMLISVHFAHQVTRSATSYPNLGTGIVLYAAMVLLATTGLVLASGIGARFYKQIRFLHPALALAFYLVIVMHIIHGI